MKDKNEFQLNELISLFLKKSNIKREIQEAEAALIWKNIAGELIAKLTVSVKVSKSVMYVTLISPALRQELSYKHDSIVNKINDYFGEKVIETIVFR